MWQIATFQVSPVATLPQMLYKATHPPLEVVSNLVKQKCTGFKNFQSWKNKFVQLRNYSCLLLFLFQKLITFFDHASPEFFIFFLLVTQFYVLY